MRTLLCLKMMVSDYQLVLHVIADEQNAHKCGWMEISNIIPLIPSCVFILFLWLHWLCWIVWMCVFVCMCMHALPACMFTRTCVCVCMCLCEICVWKEKFFLLY